MIQETVTPILKGITQTFGTHCAAALVKPDDEAIPIIVAISNGDLVSRSVGDSAHPFWRSLPAGEYLVTETVTTKSGTKFRCTSMRLASSDASSSGLLIVLDLTMFLIVDDFFRHLLPPSPPVAPPVGLDLSQALEMLLYEAIAKVGKPVTLMGKDEKLAVIRYLDQHGAFLLRGSIEDVAKELQISRFTVYNYLDEIKVGSDE